MRKVILSQVTPFNTFFLHLSKSLHTSDGQLISLITRVLPVGHAIQAIGMSEQYVDVARRSVEFQPSHVLIIWLP